MRSACIRVAWAIQHKVSASAGRGWGPGACISNSFLETACVPGPRVIFENCCSGQALALYAHGSHLETLGNIDARVPTPRDADVIGLGHGVGIRVFTFPQPPPMYCQCIARVDVSCSVSHCLPMYEGEMRQRVSNGFGNKCMHYLSYLEKNTNSRMSSA